MSVKRVNMSFDNILLFTDLDGTLLNKKTFEFKAALDLIKNCISKGINIIPNSSKTDLELDEICEKLEIPKVYISENGSCIYGLNFLSEKLNEKICLSRNKETIFKNFSDNINFKLQKKCLILENETLQNQIEVLGLPKNKISKAKTATFPLPLKISKLIQEGYELGDADDIVFKRSNSKQQNGAVGILTNNVINRTDYYSHAIILALIPFTNTKLY